MEWTTAKSCDSVCGWPYLSSGNFPDCFGTRVADTYIMKNLRNWNEK